jgi:hypothetical protein
VAATPISGCSYSAASKSRKSCAAGSSSCLDRLSPTTLRYSGRNAPEDSIFAFDSVWQEASQAEVFDSLKPVVRTVLDGFNGASEGCPNCRIYACH